MPLTSLQTHAIHKVLDHLAKLWHLINKHVHNRNERHLLSVELEAARELVSKLQLPPY